MSGRLSAPFMTTVLFEVSWTASWRNQRPQLPFTASCVLEDSSFAVTPVSPRVTGWRIPALVTAGVNGFSITSPLGNAGKTLNSGVRAREFSPANSGPVAINSAPPFFTYWAT